MRDTQYVCMWMCMYVHVFVYIYALDIIYILNVSHFTIYNV